MMNYEKKILELDIEYLHSVACTGLKMADQKTQNKALKQLNDAMVKYFDKLNFKEMQHIMFIATSFESIERGNGNLVIHEIS